jgi:DHA2 family multidrug resistance protein
MLPQYPPPLTPDGQPARARKPSATPVQRSNDFIDQPTLPDLGALTVFLMVVVMTLPVRTLPPRILFAKH